MTDLLSVPQGWAPVLARLDAGAISPQIALMQLLLAGDEPAFARHLADLAPRYPTLAALGEPSRIADLQALIRRGMDVPGDAGPALARDHFDRLAREAPEAGVALYSLGDPDLLARATAELVAVVDRWAPVAGCDLLDFGCGIGRLGSALAASARSVTGIDVSPGMIAEAQARHDASNLRFVVGNGRDLAGLGDEAFDLMVAADCWPYLVRAGTVAGHLAEARRVLRPGGSLLVFNWSYRGDLASDIADALRLGAAHGFEVIRAGEHPFTIWDAAGFQLRRA